MGVVLKHKIRPGIVFRISSRTKPHHGYQCKLNSQYSLEWNANTSLKLYNLGSADTCMMINPGKIYRILTRYFGTMFPQGLTVIWTETQQY